MADYILTQTGEQVQSDLNSAETAYQKPASGIPETDLTEDAQTKLNAGGTSYQKPESGIPASDMTSEVQTALSAASAAAPQSTTYTKAEVLSQIALALADYYLKSETYSQSEVDALLQAINNTFSSYYTKTEMNSLLDVIRQSVTSEANSRTSADNALQALISNVTSSLVNYYLKSETYSRSEVQQLVDSVKQFSYLVVATLPTASASTVGVIYLVPSPNAKTKNIKDEYITISETSGSSTTYSWEQIGSTTVDLSGYYTSTQTDAAITSALNSALASYYTKSEVDSAISSALSSYYTKAQVDSAISAEATRATGVEGALDARLLFAERSFGKYSNTSTITLSQSESGKYVNVGGTTTSASGYGISNSFSLNAGDILLVPSAQAVPADVSVVARIVTRTFDKVIGYTYTYREDYPELPLTATADYDSSLVYTAVYDETGDTPTLTGWTRSGTTYAQLPATRQVTESYYEPLVKQSVSAMPSTGYYIYLCPSAMTVVISGLTATVAGGQCIIVGWGIFKNICSNFVGAPGQAVIAQAFAQMQSEIEGLKAQLENLGETKAVCIDSEEMPKVCGEALVIEGAGAPSVVPMFVGQRYHDTTNKKVYEAFAVTNSTANWTLLN